MPTLRFEPALLEALVAVELEHAERSGDRATLRAYHAFADPLYERLAPDEREQAFAQIHLVWLEQRGWRDWFAAKWAEIPELGERATGLLLLAARRKQEEGAVLGRDGAGVCLRMLPARFTDRPRLAAFVRHEFVHASDMLDPAFGYRIEHQDTFTAANVLAERYRALWCAYVDARLTRGGVQPLMDLDGHRLDLARVFPSVPLAQQAELAAHVWNGVGLAHRDLYDRACQVGVERGTTPRPGARCPLCQFPTFDWATEIEPALARAIRADFPDWDVTGGACARCVERYEIVSGGIYA
jgi:hypothetical protein